MADPEGGEFCCFLREPAVLPGYRLHGVGHRLRRPRRAVGVVGPRARCGAGRRAAEDGEMVHTLERVTNDEVLTLDFVAVPEARRGPNRVHWDVVGDRDALVTAGATHRWDAPGGPCWPTPRATTSACSRRAERHPAGPGGVRGRGDPGERRSRRPTCRCWRAHVVPTSRWTGTRTG